jgi:hypothetical protein
MLRQQFLLSSSDVIATTCFGHTTNVCHLMMVKLPKHAVAITAEEKKRNCYVHGPLIAELISRVYYFTAHAA